MIHPQLKTLNTDFKGIPHHQNITPIKGSQLYFSANERHINHNFLGHSVMKRQDIWVFPLKATIGLKMNCVWDPLCMNFNSINFPFCSLKIEQAIQTFLFSHLISASRWVWLLFYLYHQTGWIGTLEVNWDIGLKCFSQLQKHL